MEYEYPYVNLIDRQVKVTEAEGLGQRMLSDTFDPDWEKGDEPHGVMVFTDETSPPPPPPEPPLSSHVSVLENVDPTKARPARIKRVWEGKDYFYDCFASQTVKDEYVAGKIVIGDYVIVLFDDIGEQIVTAKVFKSW